MFTNLQQKRQNSEPIKELVSAITPIVFSAFKSGLIHYTWVAEFSDKYAATEDKRLLLGLVLSNLINQCNSLRECVNACNYQLSYYHKRSQRFSNLQENIERDTKALSQLQEKIKSYTKSFSFNSAPVDDVLLASAKAGSWDSLTHYLEVIPKEKTSPQITRQLKAYAISRRNNEVTDQLYQDKFKQPANTPDDAISENDLKEILDSYKTSNMFFSARLLPELSELKERLKHRSYCSIDDIKWAITQAGPKWGSKSHRIEIFNDPNSHPKDKTGTSNIIRELGRYFSAPTTHTLSNSNRPWPVGTEPSTPPLEKDKTGSKEAIEHLPIAHATALAN